MTILSSLVTLYLLKVGMNDSPYGLKPISSKKERVYKIGSNDQVLNYLFEEDKKKKPAEVKPFQADHNKSGSSGEDRYSNSKAVNGNPLELEAQDQLLYEDKPDENAGEPAEGFVNLYDTSIRRKPSEQK